MARDRVGADVPPTTGTVAWWAALDRKVRHTRGRDGRARALDAALRIVDDEGPRALSMRRLAQELDTGPATLYRYFDGRDALLTELMDEALASFHLPPSLLVGKVEAALFAARQFRTALLRHPNLLPLLPRGQLAGPNALRSLESAIAGLRSYGVSPARACRTVLTGTHYVMGFCIQEAGGQIPAETDRADYRRLLAELPSDVYPSLTAMADEMAAMDPDEEFELGVGILLRGLLAE